MAKKVGKVKQICYQSRPEIVSRLGLIASTIQVTREFEEERIEGSTLVGAFVIWLVELPTEQAIAFMAPKLWRYKQFMDEPEDSVPARVKSSDGDLPGDIIGRGARKITSAKHRAGKDNPPGRKRAVRAKRPKV